MHNLGKALNHRSRRFLPYAFLSSSKTQNTHRITLNLAISAAVLLGTVQYYTSKSTIYNDSPLTPGEVNLKYSSDRKSTLTTEGWGSNKTRILQPEGSEDVIKTPTALKWVDNIALRDLVLHEKHAACVDARGDVYQWGEELFVEGVRKLILTLRGKNIKKLAISTNRVVALSHSGQIYVLSATNARPVGPGGWSIWDSGDQGDSIELKPLSTLSRGERFLEISAGEDHLLALTSKGRTFAHPFTKNANSHGQLGLRRIEIPSANGSSTQTTDLTPIMIDDPNPRVKHSSVASNSSDSENINFCHHLFEVSALKGIEVTHIAAGKRSSFVNTAAGRVLGWGANQFGQIGLGENISLTAITVPTEVTFWRNVSRRTSNKCLDIHAGGDLTLFTVERRDGTAIGMIDVLACGNGQSGSLGNAQYSNAQSNPIRIRNVSGLLEYSDHTNNLQPLRPHAISVSPTGHVLLMLDTLTRSTGVHSGRDLIVWGTNYNFELGTGKKTSTPSAITLQRPDGSRYMLMKAKVDVVNDMHGKPWKKGVDVEQTAVAGFMNSVVYWRIC